MPKFINSVYKTMSYMQLYFRLNHSKYQQYDMHTKISFDLKDILVSPILKRDLLYFVLFRSINILNLTVIKTIKYLKHFN